MPDQRALKILSDLYWTSKGWKEESDPFAPPPLPSSADFAYAKRKGVMFDPRPIAAAEVVRRCRKAARRLTVRRVAEAFVASLTSRRLDLRSALGSYALGRWLPQHVCRETAELECETCGFSETRRPEDLNVLNFERFKWGGARPTDPLYAALDLELFAKERPVRATSADREALAEILNRAGALAARAKPGDLDRAIGDAIPGNSPERRTLISILAICGVLEPAGHPSYRRTFVRASTIPEPPGSNNDWDYPAAWWRGSDGVSQAGVKEWFPWLRYRRKRWAR